MAPFVHLVVDDKRLQTLRALRNDDLCAPRVHVFDDPIAVVRLVRQHGIELDPLDQRRDANGIVTIGGHQNEPHEVAQGVHEAQNFGRPTAFRLSYGLALSPPFAPIPWRWTLTIVASIIAYSMSGSSLSASNIRLNTSA